MSEPHVLISGTCVHTTMPEPLMWGHRQVLRGKPRCTLDFFREKKTLVHARNMQVWRFLETSCTFLFILDSDAVPPDGCLLRMMAMDVPLVAAPHITQIGDEIGPMVLDATENPREYVQHRPWTGVQPSQAVGCAGMLIRRDVIEKVKPPWFMTEYDEKGLLQSSEDFYLCRKFLDAGYEVIWADFDSLQRHWLGRWV